MKEVRATLESQLGHAACPAEDTEDMFWLRETDDYGSKVALGNALARQYRFRDAASAYREALEIRDDEPMTWIRLGGAELTLFRFEPAREAFHQCLDRGGGKKSIAYHMGFWHYLRGDYPGAADWFRKCLPCGDEMKIAVIYWHTLSCVRGGQASELLPQYSPEMQVGHHTAYAAAVSVFCGEKNVETVQRQGLEDPEDLNASITLYGLTAWLEGQGRNAEAAALRKQLLKRDSAWPCLSYLAAWHDEHRKNNNENSIEEEAK